VEEAAVTRYKAGEVLCMVQFQYLVHLFRWAHPQVGPGSGDSSYSCMDFVCI